MKTRYGDMKIIETDEIASKSLKHYGEWAQNEIDIFKEFIKPGHVVLDVGAYIGTHTLAFSHFVGPEGKVISFEAYPKFFAVLAENAKHLKNVDYRNCGISNNSKMLVVNDIDMSKTGNFGGTNLTKNQNDGKVQIHFTTLNSVYYSDIAFKDRYFDVSFIKLDIEGMELQALSGGTDILLNCRPVVFCEVNSLQAGVDLISYMKKFNFEPFGCLTWAYNKNNFNKNLNNFFKDSKETGIIFVHTSKIAELAETLQRLKLPHLETYDDLGLMLYNKVQYPFEILTTTNAFEVWGFPK